MRVKKKVKPYIVQDAYFQKAKKEGYRARSVYKLIEIQEKFGLIQEGMNICDVGAAPGSFIQYTKRIIKDTGNIVGIDIKPIDKYSQKNIHTIVHSIFEFDTLKPKVEEFIGEGNKFDLILSDIAPNTTGNRDIDQYASVELNIEILKFADVFLKKGGNLLLKVFKGEDFFDLSNAIKPRFESFKEFKPNACRDRSFEEYVICLKKK
nr:RlmE family RNA methyltransferase [Candidatus Gracilibacteria bacterium]